ncbi:hypothetical protein [Sphingomonas sp. ID0503]|uniref:hypothetical protein n=1 Tax=Sphingomonas sp. ID0503 TaxID=3399691 RepID=UPI003AFB04E1
MDRPLQEVRAAQHPDAEEVAASIVNPRWNADREAVPSVANALCSQIRPIFIRNGRRHDSAIHDQLDIGPVHRILGIEEPAADASADHTACPAPHVDRTVGL